MKTYLYHYTTVDTFEKILENKTFRFSSLSTVDDSKEGTTKDFGNIGRYTYVSCWSEIEEETSSLWTEYTQRKGVRIKLPSNIFPMVLERPNIPSIPEFVIDNIPNIPKFEYTKGIKQIENEKKVLFFPRTVELFPITYTEDSFLLNLSVYSENDGTKELNQSLIGRFKSKYAWSHQKEWRYKISTYPFDLGEVLNSNPLIFLDREIQNMKNSDNVSFTFFDLPVDEDKFKDMEIVMSSLLDQKERDKVKEIVETYNPTAKIINSNILFRK